MEVIQTDTATESSDIDVMIVSDKYDDPDDVEVGKAWKLTRNVNSRIEPYLIGIDKFRNDNFSPLISKIKTEGIEIV